MSARDEVLRRVRLAAEAGRSSEPVVVPRAYRRGGDRAAGSPEVMDQLAERLNDYRSTVVRCLDTDAAVKEAVRTVLAERGLARVVVPAGLPLAWTPEGALVDGGPSSGTFTPSELDAVDAVLTGCAVAASETGTLVLDASAVCGRRALTLVPDVHVCVVRAAQVVQSVPEALDWLDPLRPLTFVSGPSATSDIELDRVEGVHGPRTLVVVLAG